MGARWYEKNDGPAMAKCKSLGVTPKWCPLGDGHHTDVDLSDDDKALGDALAYFLGTLFADQSGNDRYWHSQRTSVDEWSRVARALRIHGLKITNQS